MYIEREKWAREIWFFLFSLFVVFVFFYLTTHKRPLLTLFLAVGLVVAGFVVWLLLQKAKWALFFIFFFSPFFPFLRVQILRYQIVGAVVMFVVARWSEALMILALFGRKLGGIRRIFYSAPLLDFLVACYVILGCVYLYEAATSGKTFIGLWGWKDHFLFLVYYVFVRFIPLGPQDLRKILTASAWIAAAIALFGCIQAQFFGEELVRILGFGIDISGTGLTIVPKTLRRISAGGVGFMRAISILQDPLSLGAYLMVFLLVLQPFYFMPDDRTGRGSKFLLYFILLLGLFYTTTRSAWIGAAVGTAVLAWRRKKFLSTMGIFLGIGVVFVFLLLSFPGGKEFLFGSLLQSKESSLQVHLSKYGWQYQIMKENPWGLGLGMTGRVAIKFGAVMQGGFNTECWFLMVGTQMGWVGFFLYVAITLEILRKLFLLGGRLQDPFLRNLANGILAAYLACAVFGISLNVWLCHVIPIFVHLFVGMALFHFPWWDQAYRTERLPDVG